MNAISETGSFSKAARQLYLSQPAVSQRIRALESTLGIEVFDRDIGGTQLTPTEAGIEVLKFAAATLQAYEALLKRLRDAVDHESVVTIGTVGLYAGTFVMPRILPLIYAAHPELQVRVVNIPVQRLIDSARSGAVDMVLINEDRLEAGLDFQRLWEDDLIMVTHPSRRSELARQPRLIPLILSGLPEQVAFTRRWCAGLGIPSHTVVESASADTLRGAALANLGYALLPEIVVRQELETGALVRIPVPGLPLRRVVVAAYMPERATAPVVAKFLRALAAAQQQLRSINPASPALEQAPAPYSRPPLRNAIADA